jgi:uncharacterized membrane protein
MSQVVERNMQALLDRQAQEVRARSLQQRPAHTISAFAGSLTFVLIHLVMVGAWVVLNVGWTPPRPFVHDAWLAGCS